MFNDPSFQRCFKGQSIQKLCGLNSLYGSFVICVLAENLCLFDGLSKNGYKVVVQHIS